MGTFQELMSNVIDCAIFKSAPTKYRVYTYLQQGHLLHGRSTSLAAAGYDIDKKEIEFILNDPKGEEDHIIEKRSIEDIVGISWPPGLSPMAHWFKDQTCYYTQYPYFNRTYDLPDGKKPENIVGIGTSTRDIHYFWFDDNTVSYQTKASTPKWITRKYHLGKKNTKQPYNARPEYKTSEVVAMAISDVDYCYAWYNDGFVSYGKSTDLDWRNSPFRNPPKKYTIPLKLESEIIQQLFQQALGSRINENTQFIFSSNCYTCPNKKELKAILRREKVIRENWTLENEGVFGPGILTKAAMLKEVYSKNLEPFHYVVAILFGQNIEESLYILALDYEKKFMAIDPKTAKLYDTGSIDQLIPDTVRFEKIII